MTINPYASPDASSSLLPDDRLKRSNSLWKQAVIFWGIGLLLGATSRLIRDQIPGDIHYEALAELLVKLLLGLGLTAFYAQPRMQDKYLRYSVVTLVLWTGSTFGWSFVNGRFWIDHVGVNAVGLLIALATGCLSLWMVARVRAYR